MALLTLNSKTLKMGVVVGVLESYAPDKKVKEIYKEVQELKAETMEKLKELVGGNKTVEETSKILEKNKTKQNKWKKYLENKYNPKLNKIIQEIVEKNKEICPNYDEAMGLLVKEERKE
jgi:predicted Holliday junction resolvase-like endonuclease